MDVIWGFQAFRGFVHLSRFPGDNAIAEFWKPETEIPIINLKGYF